jgi:hypothetical protein
MEVSIPAVTAGSSGTQPAGYSRWMGLPHLPEITAGYCWHCGVRVPMKTQKPAFSCEKSICRKRRSLWLQEHRDEDGRITQPDLCYFDFVWAGEELHHVMLLLTHCAHCKAPLPEERQSPFCCKQHQVRAWEAFDSGEVGAVEATISFTTTSPEIPVLIQNPVRQKPKS